MNDLRASLRILATPVAILIYFIGGHWAVSTTTAALFVSAAGIAIVVAVIQKSYTMAFRDGLTALPHLEAIRKSVERYRMAMRGEDRPKDVKQGSQKRSEGEVERTLSVAISIGAAGPKAGEKPERVLKAADEALYRAKQGGRNRVSL
ncbi:MAG: diguanylate cyclase [Proteobacteria bacterium]|nr:diguanylate cyclase [Pseudomonadota bacterium]MDA0982709.1 diguanylate cyclase [Pseudomonadota bacterium]